MHRRDILRLLGGAAVMPMLAPFSAERRLAWGRSVHARVTRGAFRSLNPHQQQTVTHIAELILPESDTPGATTVKVPELIDLLLTEWYPVPERDRFLIGLADIDTRGRHDSGGVFLDLRPGDQAALLTSLDGVQGADGSAEDAFATLKRLTIYGYFTSELVMKDVIHYQVIPGRDEGCVPV